MLTLGMSRRSSLLLNEAHEGKLIELIAVAIFAIPIVILGIFPSLMLQTIVPSCQRLLQNI